VETIAGPVVREGVVTGYQGVSRNITQRKLMEQRMEFLTNNDALTGLPNRKLFESRLAHALETARAFNQKLAILLLDLDHFKNINDSLGHDVGDEMLKRVADCFSRVLHPGDTFARLGGDEFAVLVERAERTEDISRLAQELLDSLDRALTLPDGADVDIGASVGISLFPDHGCSAVELLQYADSALYRAKSEGRRTFRFFSEELTRAARERLSVETRLRHAMERNELEVHYQPIIDIRTRAITGAEALLRWRAEDGSLILPDRFIPLAEESGLILPIGEWVMRTAARQMREWTRNRATPLFIAINLSTKQFGQADLSDQLQRILDETGLPGSLLELEITESAMMPEGEHAGVLLQRLKQTGAHLAIDDFGTGYSSLAYLQRFPFDTLKIDRSFVNNINERSDDTVVVNSIIRLAQSLNLKLLAEGVETLEQLRFLQAQGCDRYQGFLFSKAVPAAEFRNLLGEDRRSLV
jgi:diguanylate cyclase (GGDEF)-like protein